MLASDFFDCELCLLNDREARLRIVGPPPSREPIVECSGPTRLREISGVDLEHQTPESYGKTLFDAVFRGQLLDAFHDGLAVATREKRHLRFRLLIPTSLHRDLHQLSWELLHDSDARINGALGCSTITPFSRYLDAPIEPPPPITGRPRLLVVISSPKDLGKYRLSALDRPQLRETIAEALGAVKDQVRCEFLEGAATLARIRHRLVDGDFHALHLHAHGVVRLGRKTPRLLLEKEDRSCDLVSGKDFAKISRGCPSLRLVVLIACHSGEMSETDPLSGLGPALVIGGIPAVVAMRRAVSVGAAARFSRRFYQRLAATGTVDAAVNEARLQLSLDNRQSREWTTPTLFMRGGQLWDKPPIIPHNEQEIPETLPFTVNRGDQERELRKAVDRHLQRPGRPLVCLVLGDDRQALDMFERRVEEEFLPSALGSRSGVSAHRLRCPPRFEQSGRLRRRLLRDLSEKFLNRPESSAAEINSALANIRRPVLIHSHLLEEECRKARVLISSFLDFWRDWPDLSPGQRLVILLLIEHEHLPSSAKGPWSAFSSFRKERQLQGLEQVFESYESVNPRRLTYAILPRLESIARSTAEHWAWEDEPQKYCTRRVLLREIRSFFRHWKAKMSADKIPMEDLAERLEMILRQNLTMEKLA